MSVFHTNSWATGLLKAINDSSNHIISSDMAVVIHDKHPKAQQHYLVLPKERIDSIFDLRPEHLPLLEELHLLALNVIEVKRGQPAQFKIGFHAKPSMQQLHLHVISQDFISDCLKTKKHWTSFNTDLFLRYEDLYAAIKTNGAIKRPSKEHVQRLTDVPLQCNQCEFIAKNMPNLKEHLLQHWMKAQMVY